MKMMFYLVDVCGKELADCLEKATDDGKLWYYALECYVKETKVILCI
jgi:hypothetical protein